MAHRLGPEPVPVFGGGFGRGITLGQELVEAVAGPGAGLDDEAAALDAHADRRPGLEVQHVKDRGRQNHHHRAADLAKIGGMHRGVHW